MKLKQYKYNNLLKQVIGFLVAGCLANLVSFSTYFISYNFLNLSIFSSSISGQLLGLITNYFVNSRFVFMKKLNLKFKIVYLSFYLTHIFLVGKSIEYLESLNFNYIYSWFICVIIAAILNFLFVKYFVFKK
ncbi:MAG: GtrA family protein [Prochlorococcus marinus XMU1428]|nr:GtrA family protein [Prochlorococcus marinus XMU1428]